MMEGVDLGAEELEATGILDGRWWASSMPSTQDGLAVSAAERVEVMEASREELCHDLVDVIRRSIRIEGQLPEGQKLAVPTKRVRRFLGDDDVVEAIDEPIP